MLVGEWNSTTWVNPCSGQASRCLPTQDPMDFGGQPGSSTEGTGQGHVPWSGATPPAPLTAEDPGGFMRRADGVWCRRDASNRLHLVNKFGMR